MQHKIPSQSPEPSLSGVACPLSNLRILLNIWSAKSKDKKGENKVKKHWADDHKNELSALVFHCEYII